MLPAKLNLKRSEKFLNKLCKCDFFQMPDSQSHIMWCSAFSNLREGKNIANDGELVVNFQLVFKIREQFEEKMKC